MVEDLGDRAALRSVGERVQRINQFGIAPHGRRLAPRQASLGLVERNPVKPGRQLRTPLEAVESAPGAQEYLLGDLLGVAGRHAEATQRPVYAIAVNLDDALKGAGVLSPGPLDQIRLVGIRGRAHRPASRPNSARRGIAQSPTNRDGEVALRALAHRTDRPQEADHAIEAAQRVEALRALAQMMLEAGPGAGDQIVVEILRQTVGGPAMIAREQHPTPRTRHERLDPNDSETVPVRIVRAVRGDGSEPRSGAAGLEERWMRADRRPCSQLGSVAQTRPPQRGERR